MFKLITLAILGYLLYRVVLEPKRIDKQADKRNIHHSQEPKKEQSGDFIDYEEID
jgi:hypothetical protein